MFVLSAIWFILGTMCFAEASEPVAPVRVKVMTFNIRLSPAKDGPDRWELRKDFVADVIRDSESDFVGIQEAWPDQIAFLAERLPEYRYLGRSREADPATGEATPLFYRHTRWTVDEAENGTFWLSDTPEVPGSRSWGNKVLRIVTWARFTEKETGRSVYVFNTHFDHQSEAARRESARYLLRRIAQRRSLDPVVVTGDFNAGEDSVPIRMLKGELGEPPVSLVDTFRRYQPDAKRVGTFGGFRGNTDGAKIDYVFTLPSAKVVDAQIVLARREGRDASDHFPVTAEVLLTWEQAETTR
jgi:endonuclease/exonuclease/phosphatase family metal-dependent hydrolase